VQGLAGGEEVGRLWIVRVAYSRRRRRFFLRRNAGRRIVGEDGGGQGLEGGFVGEEKERFLGALAREPGLPGDEALGGDALGEGKVGELAGDVASTGRGRRGGSAPVGRW